MRLWPVLLLSISCSRPNPAFFVDGAGATIGLTQGTGASSSGSSSASTATTDDDTITGAGTTEATTSAGITSTSVATTGTSADVSSTGGPVCGPFPDKRLEIDPPLLPAQCAAVTTLYGKVDKSDPIPVVALCNDAQCADCDLLTVPLAPELAEYLADGACLTVVHQGAWLPDDPEAPFGCKTTAFALYDDASIYPRYAASSRVTAAPGFLDSDVRMDVAPVLAGACDCDPADCCREGQARNLRLEFTDHGEAVGTLGPGEFAAPDLKGATYVVGVLRAHIKGQFAVDETCVADPETAFIDWEMLRILGP